MFSPQVFWASQLKKTSLCLVIEGVFVHLSGDQVQWDASLLRTCGASYRQHPFQIDGEEGHQVLLTEPGDRLNHRAGRGEGRQGEGWGALGHHHGYGIDAAAPDTEREKTGLGDQVGEREGVEHSGMLHTVVLL